MTPEADDAWAGTDWDARLAAALARAEAARRHRNAFLTVIAAAPPPPPGRPLSGLLVSVKDDLFTAGLRSTGGSRAFAEHVPMVDAPAVARLRVLGATVIGKTNLTEFAMSFGAGSALGGPCRHPADPDRWAGASSGGAAAAAALGAGDVAVATDTGGSVRGPAALCGVTAFVPTALPQMRQTGFGANRSLMAVGFLARDPAAALRTGGHFHSNDLGAAIDRLLAGGAAAPAGARFAMLDRSAGLPGHDARVTGLAGAAAAAGLAALGLRQEALSLTPPELDACFAVISDVERLEEMRQAGTLAPERVALMEDGTRARLDRAAARSPAAWAEALRLRTEFLAALADAFARVDFIVTPALPFVALRLDALGSAFAPPAFLANLAWVNLGGLPSITLPAGTVDGLPVGLQIVAAAGRDAALATLVRALTAPGQALGQALAGSAPASTTPR